MGKVKLVTGARAGSSGWVRLFGWGVSWRDGRVFPPCFSERNGYVRTVRVGRWILRWLPRGAR